MGKGDKSKKPARALDPEESRKVPRSIGLKPTGKFPRAGDKVQSFMAASFRWAFDRHELDGPFGWRTVDAEAILGKIIPRLQSFETMNWAQMEGAGCHEIALGDLAKDAYDRLTKIDLGMIDAVFSVRVTGKGRIFGFKDGAILRVLWWDPEHQVCPSNLKHT